MSKHVKCCKQTSALGVATQWACAELLQRWVCCITTTESLILLCHHKRDYIACITKNAGRMGSEGVKESVCVEGWGRGGGGTHGQSTLAGSDGVGTSAVQLATTAVLYRHFKGNTEYHFVINSILTMLFINTVVPSPFP